jgi:flagellar biosynthesis protein FlhG
MARSPDIYSDDRSKIGTKSVAVVSGKGGSGKTMVAVAMAQGLAVDGYRVLLIDTDFATGGLTYYLTFNVFHQGRFGLADIFNKSQDRPSMEDLVAYSKADHDERHWLARINLIPIGDQRRLYDVVSDDIKFIIEDIINQGRGIFDVIIVDCRGGIDSQSIDVCSACEDILLVMETDTTSIQASQHLVDILSQKNLKRQLAGFILNKVMDDPSSLAKTGSSLLRADYLGAIPFDIEATRAYIQGKVPDVYSLFSHHVRASQRRLFPELSNLSVVKPLDSAQFGTLSLRTPEAKIGAVILAAIALNAAFFAVWAVLGQPETYQNRVAVPLREILIGIGVASLLVLAALSESFKVGLGRLLYSYFSILRRLSRNGSAGRSRGRRL